MASKDPTSSREPKRKRKICLHCNEFLSNSAFYVHKEKFFINGKWTKAAESEDNLDGNINASHHTDMTLEEREERIGNSNDVSCIEEENDEICEFEEEEAVIDMQDIEICQTDNEEDDLDGNSQDDVILVQETNQKKLLQILMQALFCIQANLYLSDACLESLLGLLKLFVYLMLTILNIKELEPLYNNMPTSLYMARKFLLINRDLFYKYVVCTTCCKMHNESDCFTVNNGIKQSKTCSNILFPNHPHKTRRQQCNTYLMKSIRKFNSSQVNLVPHKVYAYRSIKESLQELLNRKSFRDLLFTKVAYSENEHYCDISDGRIWKELLDKDGRLYFEDKRNLGVMINLDWFNPYSNSEYSLGAIYLTILNLPREYRHLWEYTILVGVIPGPKEPSLNVNTFIRPLVNELIEFWSGLLLNEPGISGRVVYKMALLGISNDIPATRKFGGFIGFNAKKGCSKCFKEFPRSETNRTDYSGYEYNTWQKRTGPTHINRAEETLEATTPTEKQRLESEYGVRYSELFNLPYYDPVRMHTIDPMHNLYLGTAKHVFVVWIELQLIGERELKLIDARMSDIKVPSDIGRIPGKISECYKRMKADEWKHWTLVYSLYCLRDVVPVRHYNMWSVFVAACKIISRRSITKAQIEEGHNLLKMFCEMFQRVAGSQYCTPNMHLHLHLRECLYDYGPVYAFWCFGWERCNGMLGSFHVNNHSISVQFMRKFVTSSQARSSNFMNLDHQAFLKIKVDDSIGRSNLMSFHKLKEAQVISGSFLESIDISEQILSISKKIGRLSNDDFKNLFDLFNALYQDEHLVRVSQYVTVITRVKFANEIFTCSEHRRGYDHGSCVMVKWLGIENDLTSRIIRPAVINAIYEIKLVFQSRELSIKVARISWFRNHPKKNHYGLNSPTLIWNTTFDDVVTFVPLKLIQQRFIYITKLIRFSPTEADNVNIVIPLPSKSF